MECKKEGERERERERERELDKGQIKLIDKMLKVLMA